MSTENKGHEKNEQQQRQKRNKKRKQKIQTETKNRRDKEQINYVRSCQPSTTTFPSTYYQRSRITGVNKRNNIDEEKAKDKSKLLKRFVAYSKHFKFCLYHRSERNKTDEFEWKWTRGSLSRSIVPSTTEPLHRFAVHQINRLSS